MSRFTFPFWRGTLVTSALLLFGIHLWWMPRWRLLPPRPAFPFSDQTYLMGYSSRGIVDHYLYRFGILGFGDRIQKSDVLIIGTSHVMYGLSAASLSAKLSARDRHAVRVFNLGMGFADTAFAAHLLHDDHVRDKELIVDLFSPNYEKPSEWGQQAEESSLLGAYVQIGEIWSDFLRDWWVDPDLPSFTITEMTPLHRPLREIQTRRWDDGDTATMWLPEKGVFYERGHPPLADMSLSMGTGSGRFEGLPDRGMVLPKTVRSLIAENRLRPLLILLPFEGYKPNLAAEIAAETGYPLLLLSPDGLKYFDRDHLTAPSRDIVTERLWDEIIQKGLLPSKPAP